MHAHPCKQLGNLRTGVVSECMILASTEGYDTLCGISIPEVVGDAVSDPVLLSIAQEAAGEN